MISDDLISILVCPASKQKLALLQDEEIKKLNNLITNKELKNIEGEVIKEELEQALITSDKQTVYPIRNDIPILLIEEGIPVKGIM